MKRRWHLKAALLVVAPPARKARQVQRACVALVYETSADCAWSSIQIFVTAPHREIHIPVVQLQGHVADGMGEIETDSTSLASGTARDGFDVEALTRQILHARQHHCRDALALTLDQRTDVFGAKHSFTRTRSDLDQCGLRIKSVQLDLRGHGVLIRRKRLLLDHDGFSSRTG